MKSFSFNLVLSTKIVILLLLTICYVTIPKIGMAQTADPELSKLYITTGVGLSSNLAVNHSTITVPPVSISLDVRILPQVTIGPYVAYEKNSSFVGTEYGIVGARGTYHFAIPSRTFGVYAGAVLAYVYYDSPLVTVANEDDNHYTYNKGNGLTTSNQSHVDYTVFLGGQAHLSKNVLLFAELGYGIAYANVGLSFKLR